MYVNFLMEEGDARMRKAYGEKRYARLQALKREYDPTNFVQRDQNVPPG